jgi:hypothetical protein
MLLCTLFVPCVQDAAWFDTHPVGQLPTMIATLVVQIQDGM